MSKRPAWWNDRYKHEPDGVALVNDDMPGDDPRDDGPHCDDEHDTEEEV